MHHSRSRGGGTGVAPSSRARSLLPSRYPIGVAPFPLTRAAPALVASALHAPFARAVTLALSASVLHRPLCPRGATGAPWGCGIPSSHARRWCAPCLVSPDGAQQSRSDVRYVRDTHGECACCLTTRTPLPRGGFCPPSSEFATPATSVTRSNNGFCYRHLHACRLGAEAPSRMRASGPYRWRRATVRLLSRSHRVARPRYAHRAPPRPPRGDRAKCERLVNIGRALPVGTT